MSGPPQANQQPQSAAYEEFLRWKNSMQGKNLSDHTNTTIIKSDVIDGVGGFTQDHRLLPQNPEEEAAIIEQMKYQPKGLGKGGLMNKNYSYNTLKDFTGKQRLIEKQMAACAAADRMGAQDPAGIHPPGFIPVSDPIPMVNPHIQQVQQQNVYQKPGGPGNNIGTHLELARNGGGQQKQWPQQNGMGRGRGGIRLDAHRLDPSYNEYSGLPPVPFQSGRQQYQAAKEDKRRAFIDEWKKKKHDEQAANADDKIVLRDPKAKLITFEILTINRFAVTQNFMMPEEIVQILKKYGGAYDFEQREWIVNIQKYKEVAIEISTFCRQKIIDLDPITQMAFDIIEYKVPFSDDSKKNLVGYDYRTDISSGLKPSLRDLPPTLFHSLYNFQKVGVQYGVDNFGRCILGDEMGVGKTIQAISIAYLYQRDWPVLIVTPSSLKFSWRDELLTWIQHLRPDQIQVFEKSTQDFDPNCCIYIMSYVLATKLAAFIVKKQFKICICDEAHYLKSRDSQRSRFLVPLLIKMKRILLLSGTPILARPNELYNLVRILRPDIFFSFKEFGLRYCNPRESYFGIDWTGSSNMRELHLVLEKGLMIRRLKSEVLTELPAKRRQKIVVSTDPHVVRKISLMLKKVKTWDEKIQNTAQNTEGLLQCIADDFDGFVQNGDGQDDPTLAAIDDKYNHILNAYQLTGTAKVKGCVEFLETLIENKQKFIVFAHHYEVMDAIEDAIVKKKISYIRIDGQIDSGKRYEAVRKFQNDPNCMVGILALTASSQGITLTAASSVVFAEMNWTPGIMVQAEDRAHRIGQTKSVNVYYLYGDNTVDGMIYPRLKLKSEVFANILDGKQTEFNIENDEDAPNMAQELTDEDQKRLEKEAKLIEKTIVQDEANRLQQTNISDFFFGSGMSSSKASTQAPTDSSGNMQQDQQYSEAYESGVQDLSEAGKANEEDDFVDFDPEELEYDRPPTPPLAGMNVFLNQDEKMDCGEENFDEGTDSKWKTYQNIRRHKKQFYHQMKELSKQKREMRELKAAGLPTDHLVIPQYDPAQMQNMMNSGYQPPASVDEEHPNYREAAQNNQQEQHDQQETGHQDEPNQVMPNNDVQENANATQAAYQEQPGGAYDQSQQDAAHYQPNDSQAQPQQVPPYQATQLTQQEYQNQQERAYHASQAQHKQPYQAYQQQQYQMVADQSQNQHYASQTSQQAYNNHSYNPTQPQASQYSNQNCPQPYQNGYQNPNQFQGGSGNPWEVRNQSYQKHGADRFTKFKRNFFRRDKFNSNKFDDQMDIGGDYAQVDEEILAIEEQFLARLPQELPEVFINKTLRLLRDTDPSELVEMPPECPDGEEDEFAEIREEAVSKMQIQEVQQDIIKHESKWHEKFKPLLQVDTVFKEQDIFPGGLPEVINLDEKKRKTEEEKLNLEMKNPPSSPSAKEVKDPLIPKLTSEPRVQFSIGPNHTVQVQVAFFRRFRQYEFIQRPMTEDDKKVEALAETALDQLDDLGEDLDQVIDDAMTLQSEIDLQNSQRQQTQNDNLSSFYKQSQESSSRITVVSGVSGGIALQNKWRSGNSNFSQRQQNNGNPRQYYSQTKRKQDLNDHFASNCQKAAKAIDPFSFFEQREEEGSSVLQAQDNQRSESVVTTGAGKNIKEPSVHDSQMSFASQQSNFIPASQRGVSSSVGGGGGRAGFQFKGSTKKKFK